MREPSSRGLKGRRVKWQGRPWILIGVDRRGRYFTLLDSKEEYITVPREEVIFHRGDFRA